ncbi:mercuric reductase [bacterium]|nr:MAG: mercuric reductase [bacterium]
MAREFDLVVIGAGQAASPLVEGLKEKDWSLAVIERSSPGGSCVNFGCTPTKAVLWASRVLSLARRGSDYGLSITVEPPSLEAVLKKAREIVAESVASLRKEFGENPLLIEGEARFLGREDGKILLGVGDERILAGKVVINVGTRSIIPSVKGLSEVSCITSENWIERNDLPPRLAILGGGYIAAEMSQFYARMGSEVTVIEKGKQLLAKEDEEVGDAICTVLEEEGIRLLYERHLDSVEKTDAGLKLHMGEETIEVDAIFVAVGRQPNTSDLGLETLGIEVDEKGFVKVDPQLKTTADGVYAAGDVRGGPMFTHTAWDDGRVILTDLVGGERPSTDRVVPYAIFTDPQLGRVGMTESEAKEKGIEFDARKFDLRHNGIAHATRQTKGFVKVLVTKDDRILGATVLAPEGADLAQLFSVFVACKLSASEFRKLLVTHPTWSEAAQSAIL